MALYKYSSFPFLSRSTNCHNAATKKRWVHGVCSDMVMLAFLQAFYGLL